MNQKGELFRAYDTSQGIGRSEDYELFMRLHREGCFGYNLQEELFLYREDDSGYRKRTFSFRLKECRVRYAGFQKMGIPFPRRLPASIKPLLLGMLPVRLYGWHKQRTASFRERKTMKRSVFSQISDQVLLPVLSDFIQWVIRSAAEEGVGRLYFLARDGYPMYLAAQMFLSRKVPQIECRYLFCSRFSLRVPCFHLKGRDALKEICLGGIDVTLRKVLHRAALTEKEIVRTAEGMGLLGELDRILSYQEVQRLIPRLEKAPGFLELLYQHSREAYRDTMGYLKQKGFWIPSPAPW